MDSIGRLIIFSRVVLMASARGVASRVHFAYAAYFFNARLVKGMADEVP